MQKALQRCSATLVRSSTASALRATRIASSKSSKTYIPSHSTLRSLHQITRLRQEAATAPVAETAQDDHSTTFESLAQQNIVHPTLVNTLTKSMKIHTMTEVQKLTINTAMSGKDLIAQARTGTGKTLAFLLPIVQNIIKADPSLAERQRSNSRFGGTRSSASDIRALIISPTRELAEQIAAEARRLVASTGVVVQTAVGGTQKAFGLRKIQQEGCHLLVGTPGRLKDILTDRYTGVEAPDLNTLVFDEADRLLDQGFATEIQDISDALPSPDQRDRQTMMFSATVPKEVIRLVRSTLKPGFEFVQCVKDDETPTHERVPQRYVHAKGFENKIPALLELAARAVKAGSQPGGRPFKAIVYFNSTSEVQLYTDALEDVVNGARDTFGGAKVYGIHSKLTQSERTRSSDSFRRCSTGILISSDVTARGMDFPDVSHVIQMAPPPTREQYVHRIGRTGRAGKEGEGWLILSDAEMKSAVSALKGLPLVEGEALTTATLDLTKEADVSPEIGKILSSIQRAFAKAGFREKASAYRAMLGVFQGHMEKERLIEEMNNVSRLTWALKEPPSLSPILVMRLGLRGVEGVRVQTSADREKEGSFGSGARSYDDRRGGGFGSSDRGGGGFRRNDGSGSGRREGGGLSRGGGGFSREGGGSSREGGGFSRGGSGYGSRSDGGFSRGSGGGGGDRSGGFGGGRREGGSGRGNAGSRIAFGS